MLIEIESKNIKKQIIIIGAGGFGREALSYIQDGASPLKVKGFLDSRTNAFESIDRDLPKIIGDPLKHSPKEDEIFLVAIGNPRHRFNYTANLRDHYKAEFLTLIHPLHQINRHASMQHGCIIGPNVAVSVDVEIGNFTNIQQYTVIGHDAKIGNWCQINSHCMIAGGARIGNFVTIHPGSIITSRAVVGDGVTVGAGSVVIGKIPDGITVLGNPAKKFSYQ